MWYFCSLFIIIIIIIIITIWTALTVRHILDFVNHGSFVRCNNINFCLKMKHAPPLYPIFVCWGARVRSKGGFEALVVFPTEGPGDWTQAGTASVFTYWTVLPAPHFKFLNSKSSRGWSYESVVKRTHDSCRGSSVGSEYLVECLLQGIRCVLLNSMGISITHAHIHMIKIK